MQTSDRSSVNIPRSVFATLLAAACGMAIVLSLLAPIGHDQFWFLLLGGRVLHGARVYGPEIFDSNPPLVLWLSAILSGIAERTHLSLPLVFKLCVLLAEALTGWLSVHLLNKLARAGQVPLLTTAARLWLGFAFVSIFAVAPARDFGQRDHVLGFLILPYLLLAALPLNQSPRLATPIAAGVLAAVAVCLKPHHVLILIAVELTVVVVRRSLRSVLRPELLTALAGGILFTAALWRFAPEYPKTVVGLVRETYWAIGNLSPALLFSNAVELHVLAVIVLLLYVRTSSVSLVMKLLLVAALAATVAYYVQGTGWYYQQLPAISLFASALALLLWKAFAFRTFSLSRRLFPATATVGALAVFLTLHFSGYPITPARSFPLDSPDPSIFRSLPRGTSVAILTMEVEEAMMPIAKFHLTWASRMNNLWLLPAIFRNEDPTSTPKRRLSPADLQSLEATQHRFMDEDLERWRPAIVLVERCYDPTIQCQFLEDRHYNLLQWFSTDSRFRQIFSAYTFTGTKGRYDVYTR
jgi:hypothetical protein